MGSLQQVNPPAGGAYRPRAHKVHASASLVDPERIGALCANAAPGAPVTLDHMQVTCGRCKTSLAKARRLKNK